MAESNTIDDTALNEPTPMQRYFARVDSLDQPLVVQDVQDILKEACKELSFGEIAALEQKLLKSSELNQRTISVISKEVRNFKEGHGYLNDTQSISEAYVCDLLSNYEQVVWVGDYLYHYTSVSDGIDSAYTAYFDRTSSSEIEAHLLETYGNLPPLARKAVRTEVISRIRMKFLNESFFEDARVGVNVANGFLALERDQGITLLPHHPDHRARMKVGAPYVEGSEVGWFEQALSQSLPSERSRQALQEVAGAVLFGATPPADKLRRMFLLYGPRNSGKSTLIEAFESLLSDQDKGSVPPGEWSKETYRAALEGVSLNIVTELGGSTRIGGEQMKKIVSGETVSARRLWCNPFTFKPIARHLFATNELPRVIDASDAFERRMLVITFPRPLTVEEIDTSLGERLRSNPSDFITWAAAGALRLLRNGRFTIPDDHPHAVAEMQHGNDVPMLFASTQIRQQAGATITTDDLRQRLRAFAEQRAVDPDRMDNGSIKRVAEHMQKVLGATRHKSNGRPFYRGVAFVGSSPLGEPEEIELNSL